MFRFRQALLPQAASWFLGVVLVTLGVSPMPVQAAPSAFKDHVAIGLQAAPDGTGLGGWLPDSKIPWDYAYQYLAAGVNTGHGWATWNDKGMFPLYYANSATSHGYTPVFSYYQLLYSDGPCGTCSEGEKDLAHLNDASTMAAYYKDFTLLMQRLGPGTYDGVKGFGQTALVHVEPDLSGYAQQAAQGADPSTVPAAVASTGVADVAGFPNTYQGFNWALLHLRDEYAPNVQLAFHVSPWATGVDVGTSHDPSLNAELLGSAVGAFAAASGVVQSGPNTSTYDLLFSDVLDRDAGFYSYSQNDPNHWWDKLNVTFPNFLRWEQWVAGAVRAAGKPMIIWQIPLGNQYFQTMDNSRGHYQDNRAEYFFSHMDELRQVGVIGLLFGAGTSGVTNNGDADSDGVTNPPSFCSTDGVSSGQVCNNHQSTVSDDDGGYLRMAAQQYYANPLPLLPAGQAPAAPSTPTSSASAPAAAPTPDNLQVDLGMMSIDPKVVSAGDQFTVRQDAIVNSDATVLVDFQVLDGDGNQVVDQTVPNQRLLVGLVGSASTVLALPDDLPGGRYTLHVAVLSNDGGTVFASHDAAGALTVSAAR